MITYVLYIDHEFCKLIHTHYFAAECELLEEGLDICALFHQLDEMLKGRKIKIAASLRVCDLKEYMSKGLK